MLNRLKLGPKLIGGFILVALIVVTIGALGIGEMNKIAANDTKMYDDVTVPISDLVEIGTWFNRVRVNIRDILRANDPEVVKKKAARIEWLNCPALKAIADFEKRINSEDLKKAYDVFAAAKKEFDGQLITLKNLKLQNRDAEAWALLDGASQATTVICNDAIDKMVELKINEASATASSNKAGAARATYISLIVIGIGVLVALGLGIWLTKSITMPLSKVVDKMHELAEDLQTNMTSTMTKIAHGDLSINSDAIHRDSNNRLNLSRQDEIGILANTMDRVADARDQMGPAFIEMTDSLRGLVSESGMLSRAAVEGKLQTRGDAGKFKGSYAEIISGVNETLDAVIMPVNEAVAVLEEMSKGDLSGGMTGEYKGNHAIMKNAINSTLASLNDTLGQIAQSVDQIASGSEQVSDSSQALSQGATEQASSIEEVTSSMTEMTSQTKQNAENATQANQLASSARDNAGKGNERMREMLSAMKEINESSGQISKIIKVIDEIAFQTNLLALNAAVEAARAGVHGKGFAVVAEEVRNLAQRSAKAAKETTELIEGSVKKVENGTDIANATAKALEEIVGGVTKVTDLVGEIASASNEQAQGIEQVNTGLGQIDQVTQSNTASAEESASAAEELSGQAAQLKADAFEIRT